MRAFAYCNLVTNDRGTALFFNQVDEEDISGIGFVVFERPEATILSCHVEGNDIDMLQPHLSVEIRSAVDPSRIESVVPVPLSYHVEVRNLPKGKHFVQLRSGLPSHTHIFESELVEVDLEKQPQIHVGPLKYKTEERHHKQVTFFMHLRQHCITMTYTLFVCLLKLGNLR